MSTNTDGLRSLVWIGDSKRQLLKMPQEIRRAMGFQLQAAQKGEKPGLAQPFKGVGSGVFEIRKDYHTNTYRAVYAVQIGQSMYVLHVFQKKSTRGIQTPKADVALIKQRYREAQELAKHE
jgi:phage-related protein